MTNPDNHDVIINENNNEIGIQTTGTAVGFNTDPPQQPDVFLRRLPPSLPCNGISGIPFGSVSYVYPQNNDLDGGNPERVTNGYSGLPSRTVYVPPVNGRRPSRTSRSSDELRHLRLHHPLIMMWREGTTYVDNTLKVRLIVEKNVQEDERGIADIATEAQALLQGHLLDL
ncbi:hypothetical protein FOL47_009180 [Perkinsus chesapeaki]|uniref:Uncharacterized protein n=1 Tax=Perkinsus chesapeaki TaxID=330153 RepID=A0A7J6LA86_PERCH|nr:hypothetical protein FOL47_009180 [Perkinsus chesapeaki]